MNETEKKSKLAEEEEEEEEELAEIPLNNFERKQSIKGHGEEVNNEIEEKQVNVHRIF